MSQEPTQAEGDVSQYDLTSTTFPRLSGSLLRVFVGSIESSVTNWALMPKLKSDGGFHLIQEAVVSEPLTPLPLHPQPEVPHEIIPFDFESVDIKEVSSVPFPTIFHYARLYREGKITPIQVAESVIKAMVDSDKENPPLKAFIKYDVELIRKQARESTERFLEKKPLSLMDGVPLCVKDEVDMIPFDTTGGTSFFHIKPTHDGTTVAKLRASGAVLIGKTNMQEIGLGVKGNNPHYGCCRNPYNVNHHTGGSSSGTASVVGSGMCPAGLGADGGGSIRIPASFCGIVGLKATFGRISEHGAFPLCWSVGHLGPMANTALDCAYMYTIMAGRDPEDPNTMQQPPIHVSRLTDKNLAGLKIGIFTPYFRHATKDIVDECYKLVDYYKSLGAEVVEVTIPNLNLFRLAHAITILSEMAAGMDEHYQTQYASFGLETRVNLAAAKSFQSVDYVKSQRLRTRAIKIVNDILKKVDVIATPATAITAPPINPSAIPDGESDNTTTVEIMRFCFLTNLTGHPSISFPAGYSNEGLPIGFQFIGRAWNEDLLLRLAHAAESFVQRQKPNTDVGRDYNPLAQLLSSSVASENASLAPASE